MIAALSPADVNYDETRNSLVSASRFNDIVNANSPIFNRGSSSFIGTTTPYNPFGYYRNRIAANDATTNYARVTVKDTNESTLAQVSAVLSTADLLKFPHGSVGFAVGVDFRREQLDQEPDAFGSSGDLIGQAPRATTTAPGAVAPPSPFDAPVAAPDVAPAAAPAGAP